MISVIVPIYNVEKYLEECLLSIQNQTYKDFECIMINDGSTDSSVEIVEKFSENDDRFKLINQENSGQSVARNVGIAQANGEYLMFVDSDDVIKYNLIENLFTYMSDDIDIVECNQTRSLDEFQLETNEVNVVFKGKGQKALEAIVLDKILSHNPSSKLYRKECFEEIGFPEQLIYEDLYMYMYFLKNNRNIVKIDYVGYYYRINPNSTMKGNFSEKNLDIFPICDRIETLYVGDKGSQPLVYRHLFACLVYHYLSYVEKNNPYKGKYEQYLKKYAHKAQKSGVTIWVYKLFPKHFKSVMKILDKVKTIKGS